MAVPAVAVDEARPVSRGGSGRRKSGRAPADLSAAPVGWWASSPKGAWLAANRKRRLGLAGPTPRPAGQVSITSAIDYLLRAPFRLHLPWWRLFVDDDWSAGPTPPEHAVVRAPGPHPRICAEGSHPVQRDRDFADHRFKDLLIVTEASVRAYAGHPILDAHGTPVGSICVLYDRPHQFSPEQLLFLQELAGRVEALLATA
jgi:GAF domain